MNSRKPAAAAAAAVDDAATKAIAILAEAAEKAKKLLNGSVANSATKISSGVLTIVGAVLLQTGIGIWWVSQLSSTVGNLVTTTQEAKADARSLEKRVMTLENDSIRTSIAEADHNQARRELEKRVIELEQRNRK